MNVKGPGFDPTVQKTDNRAANSKIQQNLGSNMLFRDMLVMMQKDGLVAKDAKSESGGLLSDADKESLRSSFDIENMASYTKKRALLNELVSLGALGAEESELSLHQIIPPHTMGLLMGGGLTNPFAQNEELESIMNETNYLSYLQQAIKMDNTWSNSDDVKAARVKVYELLTDIFA